MDNKTDLTNLYDNPNTIAARSAIHQAHKDFSDIYMRSQLLLKREGNLSASGIADTLKMKMSAASGLHSVAQLKYMMGDDEFSPSRPAVHSISEILRKITNTFNDVLFLNSKTEIEFNEPEKDYMLKIDVARLEQILFSIIENSTQYGSQNKRIALSVKRMENNLRITVKERDEAIDESDFALLFKKYETVTEGALNPYIRQGLSLAIAQKNAAEMGGSLSAENQKTGLKFTLFLPLGGTVVSGKTAVYTLTAERLLLIFADLLLKNAEKDILSLSAGEK